MEFLAVIQKIQHSQNEIIGVEVPEHFQWSMLDLFKEKLPYHIVIPLYRPDHDITNIIYEHLKYFQCPLVFLFDDLSEPEEYVFKEIIELYEKGKWAYNVR